MEEYVLCIVPYDDALSMLWCHITRPPSGVQKKGVNFTPGSSYWQQQVESKGAAGIPRQPIILRFVGYPAFAGRLPVCGDSVNPGGGVKLGGKWGIVLASHTLIALIILIPPPLAER